MRSLAGVLFAGVLVVAALTTAAFAQRYSTENFGKGIATVSVQYMIRLPLKSDDIASQRDAMEQGRKLLYEMGSSECALIVATFASSCQLTSLNVQTNISRQCDDNSANMSANAQFRVELKQKADASPDANAKPNP
jgi:hypothetical protein